MRRGFTLAEMIMYVALSALILGVVGSATHALSRAARSRSRVLETRLPLLECFEAFSADVDATSSSGFFSVDGSVSLCPVRGLSPEARVLYESSLRVYRWDASEKVLSRFVLDSGSLSAAGLEGGGDQPVLPTGPQLLALRGSALRSYALGAWSVAVTDGRHVEVVAAPRGGEYSLARRFNFNQ
jgi:hypothetical protein